MPTSNLSGTDRTLDSTASKTDLREKIELLSEFVKSSIADVSKKRKLNQRRATAIKVMILCTSGGATILLGLNLDQTMEISVKNIAFTLTSLVTLLNALEPFFNYRALWVEHERANAAFFHLKDRMQFYSSGRTESTLEADQIEKFYTEYEQIWASLNQAWTTQRQSYQVIGPAAKS